jgi:uncharacterized alkaline shock family protein YloU
MIYQEENKNGKIKIGRAVIEGVCARVINGMDGRLIVSDSKGRLRKGALEAAEDETGFARARLRAGVLDLKLFLIVRFGVSIRETAEELVLKLRAEFPVQTGVGVGLITVVFVGTLAEKLRRRNIMFVDDGTLHEVGGEDEPA